MLPQKSGYDDMTNPGWTPPGEASTYTLDMSVRQAIDLVRTGSLNLSPPFQRHAVWDRLQKGEFIESLLTELPTPPMYLAEESQGRLVVIDGKQRLVSILEFVQDEFAIMRAEISPELEGLRFGDLHESVRHRFMNRAILRFIVLREPSGDWAKTLLFERLNSSGRQLSRQELRNAKYSGPLNDHLIELSNAPFLIQQIGSSHALRDMSNVEYVLRFVTLSATNVLLEKNILVALDRFLESQKHASAADIREYGKRFLRSLRACEALFGEQAFRRFDGDTGWRSQFSLPVYDAEMLAFAQVSDHVLDQALAHSDDLKGRTSRILDRNIFNAAASVNKIPSIHARASAIREVLEDVADGPIA